MPNDDDASVTSVAGPSLIRERTPDIERGTVLAGRYQVEAIIGKGGSGIVLRAFDRTAQMVVAVKVLKSELVHDERWSKRFSRELRLGRPIRHPNVCRIFDIGEGDGHRFLTMELASGGTLRDLIKKGDPLRPLDERLRDAAAAIGGLAAIHEAGIVHRDVKPDNMLRMADGRLAISDFGLATDLPAAAAVTVMVGTPHYMAPEVRAGEPATTRSDVWALGVVLHEIFFGKRPERRSSLSSEGFSRPPGALTASAVERAMLALCERCLAENPLERPPDASAVARLFGSAQSSPFQFLRAKQLLAAAVAVGLAVVGSLAAVKVVRKVRTSDGASKSSGPTRLEPRGQAADWTRASSLVAEVPGGVRCFSKVDAKTVRLVWGRSRSAEDVDVFSGARRRTNLLPATYVSGCPQLAPQGDRLLFTAVSPAGVSEVLLSPSSDGAGARTITPGMEPIWLKNGEEFLYSIDPYHPALFSLRTMSFTLLPDPGLGGRQLISEKAASWRSDAVAVLFVDYEDGREVAVYERGGLVLKRTYALAAGSSLDFDPMRDDLLISYNLSPAATTLVDLDWHAHTLTHLGRYAGFNLARRIPFDQGIALSLASRKLSDAWIYESSGKRQLTHDGATYSGTISKTGDVLLGRLDAKGVLALWWQRPDGTSKRVTDGPGDVLPDFAPDGRRWTYVDYPRKSIMICPELPGACSVLRRDETFPAWPRFSPDATKLAYVTQAGGQRVMVLSLLDGSVKELGAAFAQCPAIWTAPDRLLIFEGSPGRYSWVERDVSTGGATGLRIEVNRARNDANQSPDQASCWPDNGATDPFPRIRIEAEETSRLLRFDPLGVQ